MAGVAGRTLGNFVVEEEIGRGGMGVVLRARQPLLDRQAVLKKVRRELAELPELAERFAREARAAAAVHHPNVVAVYDHFTWRGDHYIAQEYVDGLDLEAALVRAGRLPWRVAALAALELARGLEEIHAQGTVHRDLKPSNILLGRRGEVKIADFGVALEAKGGKLTQPGTLVGTPSYMAPEQLEGSRADTRSDLFSLGVVWYELLAGSCPHPVPDDGESLDEMLHAMTKERYEPLGAVAPRTPRAHRRLVKRCLRSKPSRRLGSARELRVRLEQLLGRPSPADLRNELAFHFWDRGVFEQREKQTLVLAPPVAEPPVRRVFGWVPAAAAALLVVASLLVIDVRPLPGQSAAGAPGSEGVAVRPPLSKQAHALRAQLVATAFDPMQAWQEDPSRAPQASAPPVFEGDGFEDAERQLRSFRRR